MGRTDREQAPEIERRRRSGDPVQKCPQCGALMPAIAGSRAAICTNCGYKEGCC